MSNLESIGEVFAGDVLIIGGGIAGLIAANRIKESNPQLQVRIVGEVHDWMGRRKGEQGRRHSPVSSNKTRWKRIRTTT